MPVYRTIREQITERIRSEVLSQKLPSGTNMREQALAEKYGVSRAPVRDALLQLTNEGLLVAKPNCGVRVAGLLKPALQPLVIRLRLEIETFALNELIDDIGNVNFEPFKLIVEELKSACNQGDLSAIAQCDMAFHRFIIAATSDEDLMALWLPTVSRMMLNYTRHHDWMESYREHAAIADAIISGDREAAISGLTDNIQ